MKRLFNSAFIALALTLAVSACNSGKTENTATDSLADTIDSTGEAQADTLRAEANAVDSTADAKADSIDK